MILDILITEAERWQMLTWPVFGQNKTNKMNLTRRQGRWGPVIKIGKLLKIYNNNIKESNEM
jgi:hypothetical protein